MGDDQLVHLALECLGTPVVLLSPQLTIRAWNRAASERFTPAVTLSSGASYDLLVPLERRDEVEKLLRQVLASGQVRTFDWTDHNAQGQSRELLCILSPIINLEGVILGASLCFHDLTSRMRAHDDRSQQRKLTALGEMAGAVAHHFNNILGGVITSIDFANTSDDAEVKDRVLQQTSRALLRATSLVRNLLVFAEGEPVSDDLSDLTEILHELADDFEPIAARHHVTLEIKSTELGVLAVPRVAVRTALRNVMQNAVDAMPDGGKLTVQVEQKAEHVIVKISDTGCGINEQAMSRLFEPFYSTKPAQSVGAGATAGMGLAIAHGLLRIVGGTISFTSQPGQGTCCTIILPRDPPTPAATDGLDATRSAQS